LLFEAKHVAKTTTWSPCENIDIAHTTCPGGHDICGHEGHDHDHQDCPRSDHSNWAVQGVDEMEDEYTKLMADAHGMKESTGFYKHDEDEDELVEAYRLKLWEFVLGMIKGSQAVDPAARASLEILQQSAKTDDSESVTDKWSTRLELTKTTKKQQPKTNDSPLSPTSKTVQTVQKYLQMATDNLTKDERQKLRDLLRDGSEDETRGAQSEGTELLQEIQM